MSIGLEIVMSHQMHNKPKPINWLHKVAAVHILIADYV